MANGLSGADVARQILDRNGLQNVPVETSPGGPLSDHYDPRQKSVHLSEPVYSGRAVASTAIAAHEVGHAIQHAKAYAPFRLRSAMWPAVAFASNAWIFLLMIGAFAQLFGLVTFAIILYAVVVLFQLVTLPVEFDASRRALTQLNDMGLVTAGESQGARKVLTAAAMTYVAAALAALTELRVLRARSSSATGTEYPRCAGSRSSCARAQSSVRSPSSSRCSSTARPGPPPPRVRPSPCSTSPTKVTERATQAKKTSKAHATEKIPPGVAPIVATGDIVMGSTPNLPPDGGRSFFWTCRPTSRATWCSGTSRARCRRAGARSAAWRARTASRSIRHRRTLAGSRAPGSRS